MRPDLEQEITVVVLKPNLLQLSKTCHFEIEIQKDWGGFFIICTNRLLYKIWWGPVPYGLGVYFAVLIHQSWIYNLRGVATEGSPHVEQQIRFRAKPNRLFGSSMIP